MQTLKECESNEHFQRNKQIKVLLTPSNARRVRRGGVDLGWKRRRLMSQNLHDNPNSRLADRRPCSSLTTLTAHTSCEPLGG
jgi:hypothetical protein